MEGGKIKIGFIGTGNMGASLALSIKDYPNSFLLLNNRTISKAEDLHNKIKNSEVVSAKQVIEQSDFLFIGVKPIELKEVLKEIKQINNKSIIISMVAGIYIKEIKSIIDNPIIRILPNTPVSIKSGLTLVCYSSIDDINKNTFINIMKETGELVEIKEEDINKISVITGSAPAYLDYFIDALIKAGIKQGLNEKDVTNYVLKMIEGTIKLNIASNKSPLELGKEVCSPGGSTIEGVNILLEKNIYKMIEDAYLATLNKNKKII